MQFLSVSDLTVKIWLSFSEMKAMELWHFSLGAEMMISRLKDPEIIRRGKRRLAKEKARSIAEEIFPQIGVGSGEAQIHKG